MHAINCGGKLLDLSSPLVMGILNITPDSFYDGGLFTGVDAALQQAEKMIRDGTTIIDIGGASSRPGATEVPTEEEYHRVIPAIRAIEKAFPEVIISIDTWRAEIALAACENGAHIINDISAGSLDPRMFDTVAALQVPYILMHIQGRPENMQEKPVYTDVVTDVLDFLIAKTIELRGLGVKDIIVDPGFGFGKTIEQNYTLLKSLSTLKTVLNLPVLAGISRKSMIWKLLKTTPEEALNGTTALNLVALQQGASILRVHDVKPAVEVLKLWKALL